MRPSTGRSGLSPIFSCYVLKPFHACYFQQKLQVTCLRLKCAKIRINSLLFTDDSLLLMKANERRANHLQNILSPDEDCLGANHLQKYPMNGWNRLMTGGCLRIKKWIKKTG